MNQILRCDWLPSTYCHTAANSVRILSSYSLVFVFLAHTFFIVVGPHQFLSSNRLHQIKYVRTKRKLTLC